MTRRSRVLFTIVAILIAAGLFFATIAERPPVLADEDQSQEPQLGERGPWFAWPLGGTPPKEWQGHRLGTLLTMKAVRTDAKQQGGYHVTEIEGKPADFYLGDEVDFNKLLKKPWPVGTKIAFRAFAAAPWYADQVSAPGYHKPAPEAEFHERLVVTAVMEPTRLERSGVIARLRLNDSAAGKGSGPSSIVPLLVKGLQSGDKDRILGALEILAALGPEATPAVDAISARATDENEDFRTRYEAAALLHCLDRLPDSAIAWVVGVAKSDDAFMIEKALFLLGRIGPRARDAVPLCVERLVQNRPPGQPDNSNAPSRVAEAAAWALGRIGIASPEVNEALIKGARDPVKSVRRRSLVALSALPQSGTDPVLVRATADADKEIAAAATIGLGNVTKGADANLKLILVILDRQPEESVEMAAFEALRRLGPAASDARPNVNKWLNADTPLTRRAAILSVLAAIDGKRTEPILGFEAAKVEQNLLKTDKERLQGTWVSVSFEAAGTATNSRKLTLTFNDEERLTMKVDNENSNVFYELGVESEPMRMDIVVREGGLESSRNHGIYKLEGDTLTICHGGHVRPTKFEVRRAPNSTDSLIVLKRKNPLGIFKPAAIKQ